MPDDPNLQYLDALGGEETPEEAADRIFSGIHDHLDDQNREEVEAETYCEPLPD